MFGRICGSVVGCERIAVRVLLNICHIYCFGWCAADCRPHRRHSVPAYDCVRSTFPLLSYFGMFCKHSNKCEFYRRAEKLLLFGKMGQKATLWMPLLLLKPKCCGQYECCFRYFIDLARSPFQLFSIWLCVNHSSCSHSCAQCSLCDSAQKFHCVQAQRGWCMWCRENRLWPRFEFVTVLSRNGNRRPS